MRAYRGTIRVFPHYNSRSYIVYSDMQVSTFVGPGFTTARQDFSTAFNIFASTALGLQPQSQLLSVNHSFFKIDGRRTNLDAIVGISISSIQLSDEDKVAAQYAIASALRRLFGLDCYIRIEDDRESGVLDNTRHSRVVAYDDALVAVIELQLKRGQTNWYDNAHSYIQEQVRTQLAHSSDPKALRAYERLLENSMV